MSMLILFFDLKFKINCKQIFNVLLHIITITLDCVTQNRIIRLDNTIEKLVN